jgi:hypothetical protein
LKNCWFEWLGKTIYRLNPHVQQPGELIRNGGHCLKTII